MLFLHSCIALEAMQTCTRHVCYACQAWRTARKLAPSNIRDVSAQPVAARRTSDNPLQCLDGNESPGLHCTAGSRNQSCQLRDLKRRPFPARAQHSQSGNHPKTMNHPYKPASSQSAALATVHGDRQCLQRNSGRKPDPASWQTPTVESGSKRGYLSGSAHLLPTNGRKNARRLIWYIQ